MFTKRERRAIAKYDADARKGLVNDLPIWADSFTISTFSRIPGDQFVDVGCGDGRFTTILTELGIPREGYLGIDPSLEQVRLAQKLHPAHRFEVGNIYELGTRYPATFDGFTCSAVLMLLPRARITEALSSLRASLRQMAVGFISTPVGQGEGDSASGLRITLYEAEELKQYLKVAGFEAVIVVQGHMMICSLKAI